MSPFLVLVAAAALGIEVGWQPLPQGGHEYTIQLEPQLLDVLKKGKEDIVSEVPPHLDVRRYRITVGTGKLARDAGRPEAIAAPVQPQREPLELGQESGALSPTTEDMSRDTSEDIMPVTAADERDAPARLPEVRDAITPVDHRAAETVETEKPALPPGSEVAEAGRPWLAFLTALVLLCCSLGANVYLGWIAWEARSRYRDALSKFRPAGGT
jgi:hypothetical protein